MELTSLEWIGGGLIALALALMFLETQMPGIGVFGISGAAFLVIGTLILTRNPAAVAGVGVISLASAGLTFKAMRQARRARRYSSPTHPESLIGQLGKTTTPLAPRGNVLVSGERWSAESDSGEHIAADESVVVLEADGLTLKVFRAGSELTKLAAGDDSDDSIH